MPQPQQLRPLAALARSSSAAVGRCWDAGVPLPSLGHLVASPGGAGAAGGVAPGQSLGVGLRFAHLPAATDNINGGRSTASTATSGSVVNELGRMPVLRQHGLVHEHVSLQQQQQQQQRDGQHIVQHPHASGVKSFSFRTGTAAGGNTGTWRLWPLPASLSPLTPSAKAARAVPPAVRQCHSGPAPQEEPTKPPAPGAAASNPTAAAAAPAAAGTAASSPHPVYNLPNLVSVGRLVSGPVIGMWLYQGHFQVAMVALAVSGASDWLDGYLARRMGSPSVFGSYLDPLADKVLIGCVAAALLARGTMPVWLAAVVVGRDVALVAGAFVFRFRSFGWRWPGSDAFFRTADAAGEGAAAASKRTDGAAADSTAAAPAGGGGVGYMRPLMISKANTVLQLMLVGGYLTQEAYGWPGGEAVAALEAATAATTVLSGVMYGMKAMRGEMFK